MGKNIREMIIEEENSKIRARMDSSDFINQHGKEVGLNLANSYLSDCLDNNRDSSYWNSMVKEITKHKKIDMKREDVKITVTIGQISEANLIGAWDKFCDKYGYNYYCLNEGADRDSEVKISLVDAENWGLIEKV